MTKEDLISRFRAPLLTFVAEAWSCRNEAPAFLDDLYDQHQTKATAILDAIYAALAKDDPSASSKADFSKKFRGTVQRFVSESWASCRQLPSSLGMLIDQKYRKVLVMLVDMHAYITKPMAATPTLPLTPTPPPVKVSPPAAKPSSARPATVTSVAPATESRPAPFREEL